MPKRLHPSKVVVNYSENDLGYYSTKDDNWNKHRSNTQGIERLYSIANNPRFEKYAERLSECSTLLAFKQVANTSTGELRIKLRKTNFCRIRQCPVCSWRRSMRNVQRFFSKLPELQASYPKARWLFLTLTVPNCPADELRSKLSEMNKAWQRLIQTKAFPAIGFVRSTEVTRSKKGEAHPHFHCLLMVNASYFKGTNYLSQAAWTDMWKKAMRLHEVPIVDVRAVKAKHEGQSVQAAIVETLKYATKVEDGLNHPEWLYTITDQLRGLRFIASGGVLKNILKEDLSEEEMIAGDEAEETGEMELDESADLFFGWKAQMRKYQRVNFK